MKPTRGSARLGDAVRVLRSDGPRGLAQRMARIAYRRSGAAALEFPLLPGDIADSSRLDPPVPLNRPARGTPLRIGWISSPPGPGSGGHTTMFRMMEALEAAGHTCVLYLYDRYGGDTARQIDVVRQWWPAVRADVRSIDDGIGPLDGVVATAWPTAHVLARRVTTATRRFYFVQDYEPYFYPLGTEYALAEDTYRFGFRCITVGRMIAGQLRVHFDIDADVAEFGCDTEVYHLTNRGQRSGVIFYAKPNVGRRGYQMGMLALAEFHRSNPDQPIHLFGETPRTADFPFVDHGKLRPAELNRLYNEVIGGFALSFTNVSLVPDEMLAAGAVPVANDSELARVSLPNPHVRWAPATPRALADALSEVVHADIPQQAAAAAADVRAGGWAPGQAALVSAIEDEIYG